MKRSLLAMAMVLVLVLVSCGGGGGGPPKPGTYPLEEPTPAGAEGAIEIKLLFTETEIQPDHSTVPAGAKVLFIITNVHREDDHNLVSKELKIKEILVHPNQTVRRLWDVPDKRGTFVVGCTIHPEIRMTIAIE